MISIPANRSYWQDNNFNNYKSSSNSKLLPDNNLLGTLKIFQ